MTPSDLNESRRSGVPMYRWAALLIALLAITLVVVIVIGIARTTAVQAELRETLRHDLLALKQPCTVRVNGALVPEPQRLIQALRSVGFVPAHHSEPLSPIDVTMDDGTTVVRCIVARDSQRSDEYWVLMPPNTSTPIDLDPAREAGRISGVNLKEYFGGR